MFKMNQKKFKFKPTSKFKTQTKFSYITKNFNLNPKNKIFQPKSSAKIILGQIQI